MDPTSLALPPPAASVTSLKNVSAPLICFSPNRILMVGVWHDELPQLFSFTLFVIQLLLVISTTRGSYYLLGPLKLPRYISEIVGGFLLGPSVVGMVPYFAATIFPQRSLFILESIAYLGLIFYIFTVGVEIDIPSIQRSGWRGGWFAVACTVPPFVLGSLSAFAIHNRLKEGTHEFAFVLFISISVSFTAFSVLARTVAELKLAGTEVGKMALSAAILVDGFTWVGLSVVIAISESDGSGFASIVTMMSAVAFYIICFVIIRPMFNHLSKKIAQMDEQVRAIEEYMVILGVVIAALIGDIIGIHVAFGAFVYGLAVPSELLGVRLLEKVDAFVKTVLLPLFFAISGLRTDVSALKNLGVDFALGMLVLASGAMKIVGGVLVAAAYDMQLHDGVSFGLLMNTKGVVEFVLLNVGINKKILGNESFTVLVIMSVVETIVLTKTLPLVVKPTRRFVFYKRRTIRCNDPSSELRIMACVHHPRDPPALISLIASTNPTKRSPVLVSAVQLIELTGRASTLLLMNNASSRHNKFNSSLEAQSVAIANTFESYVQEKEMTGGGGVAINTTTAISPFDTMHEDVILAAEDRHTALILLPFHMHQAVDGALEATVNPCVRDVNARIMRTSPCTIAVVIDRGLGGNADQISTLRVVVLFFGGPDDRESIALVGRMANNSSIEVSVVRFLPKNINTSNALRDENELRERQLDEDCLLELGQKSSHLGVVGYRESVVSNAEDIVEDMKMILDEKKELIIVGKDQGLTGSRLMAGMTEWSEFPELGPIGDLLASHDHAASSSVLVIQAPKTASAQTDSTVTAIKPEKLEDTVRGYANPR